MRNRIYGSAALDLAEVERGAWSRGNFRVNEAHRAAHQRVNRIGNAEIRPAMAARAGNDNFHAARSQRFGGNVISTRTIEDNHGFESGAVCIYECAHATQVAFAFFA